MSTRYEWDIETHTDTDIIDHDHRDKLSEFGLEALITAINRDNALDKDTHYRLVLVRSGDSERLWAYVDEEGKLPEYFSRPEADGKYYETNVRVPKRFHTEFNR